MLDAIGYSGRGDGNYPVLPVHIPRPCAIRAIPEGEEAVDMGDDLHDLGVEDLEEAGI
jgi:hypothetical protein